jgi:two-component system response regulator FixJ
VSNQPTVFIVDGDRAARRTLVALVESMQLPVEAFASAEEYLDALDSPRAGCLLVDLGGAKGEPLEWIERLLEGEICPPVIFVSAHGDVPTAVRAMKAGAVDFLEKPCRRQRLWEAIQEAQRRDAVNRKRRRRIRRVQRRIAHLTPGERDVLRMLAQGKPNNTMATLLGLSVRAIEVRRAKVMRKMQAGSLAELVRMTLAAGHWLAKPRVRSGEIF